MSIRFRSIAEHNRSTLFDYVRLKSTINVFDYVRLPATRGYLYAGNQKYVSASEDVFKLSLKALGDNFLFQVLQSYSNFAPLYSKVFFPRF